MTVPEPDPYPQLIAMVLDAVDSRGLAEFYRELLGWSYRPGDETPGGEDWLVLMDQSGHPRLAVQRVAELTPPSWPAPDIPQQAHLDFRVDNDAELARHHRRAIELGATLLEDRSTDDAEHINVYADPAGHPFCILVVDPSAWAKLVPE